MVRTCRVCKQRDNKSEISFHQFPTNSTTRQEWLDAIGQSDQNPGKRATICSSHFDDNCFSYGLIGGMRYLKPNSYPTLNLGERSVPENNSNQEYKVESFIDKLPSSVPGLATSNKDGQEAPLCEVTPKKKIRLTKMTWEEFSELSSKDPKVLWENTKQEITTCQKKIECLQRNNRRLRRKVTSMKLLTKQLCKQNLLKEKEATLLHSTMDPVAMDVFKQMSSRRKKVSEYPLSLRTFAATLLFLSPKAYKYTRKIFSLALPHPSTVRKWFTSIDGSPGISKPALQVLEGKVLQAREKGKSLLISVTVDDMAIRKHIRWNGKKYSGFATDTNGSRSTEIKTAMITQAMVVMVVCLNEHWKIPMSYYLIDSLNGEARARLLSECFVELHRISLNVVSLTFDGAPSNVRMAKELGAKFTFTEKDTMHFPHPVTKEPIPIIIDACHAIKLIRNTLADRKILYDSDGNPINWEYFATLVRTQYKYGLHAGTKIRKRHLNWAQEKMKVKLAAQTLSASTAHALNFLRSDIKLPEFKQSEATEKFCLVINNCFDILNSRQKVSKVPSKSCIHRDNVNEIRSKIREYQAFLISLKDGDKPILESKRRMGFFGLVTALENVIAIFEKWSTSEIAPLEYLLTYKLSQDHVELFFSAVRSRGGNNNNPTAEQFESAFKWLLIYAQIGGSAYANCLPQDGTCLLQAPKNILDKSALAKKCNNSNDTRAIGGIFEVSLSPTLDHDYCASSVFKNVNIQYINNILAYTAGFVARSLIKSIGCAHCVKSLQSTQCFSSIQIKKCQGRLTRASEDLIQVCRIGEECVRSHNVFQTENILNVLIRNTLSRVPPTIFRNKENCCADHRQKLLVKILRLFFKIRLHHEGASRLEEQEDLRIRAKSNKIVLFKNQ